MTILPDDPSPALAAALSGAQETPVTWPVTFVDAVKAILTEAMPGQFKVADFPDRPEDFDIGEYEGAVLVHWIGSKYAPSNGVMPINKKRRFTFDVAVIARGVSGMLGAPNVIELVRQTLQARVIEGATALDPVDDGLAGRNDQTWRYDITFQAEAPAIGGRWPHPSEAP
ncbi:Gp37 family protein [Methylocystis sp. S23]